MATNEELSKRVSELESQIKSLVSENKGLTEELTKNKTKDVEVAKTYEFQSQAEAIFDIGKATKSAFEAFGDGISNFTQGVNLLEEKGVEIQNSFGVSRQRMEEFKTLIADVAPQLAAMGVQESEFASTVTEVTSALGGTATLTADAIVDIKAAALVTKQEVGDLAKNFREVGISMYNVGEEMLKVTDYAKKVGVPVKAVADGVVANLNKINLYTFQNGVEGLTKMSAQAARLGVSMDTVFGLAEQLFSPEKAIEYSAALQRLGVTSNGLLDPLRSMDMAQNDPEALQKELVNLTKDFVRFSEENNKFEVMPGAQRKIREIATELNIPAKELAQMGIQAAEFDRKLEQINLPELAGDEQTKELIASMAQLKDGVATLTVKNIQTGEVTYKTPDQLTASDIESLKYQEEESSKTIEELAIEQLDQAKMMNSQLDAIRYSGMLAAPSLGTIQRLTETSSRALRGGISAVSSEVTTSQVRQVLSPTTRSVEDAIISFLKGDQQSLNNAYNDFTKSLTHVQTEVGGMADRIVAKFETTLQGATKPYEPVLQRMENKSEIKVGVEVDLKGNTNSALSTTEFKEKLMALFDHDSQVGAKVKQLGNTSQLNMNPKTQ